MPPLAAGRTSTNDIWMPPPRHPDERISIGWRRHPDERIFGYPLQALILSEQAERKSEVASARVITFRLATEQFASVSGMHTLKQDDPELHVHFLCRETEVLMALEQMSAAEAEKHLCDERRYFNCIGNWIDFGI